GKVGCELIEFLRPATSNAKTGDNFIEYQQRTIMLCQFAQTVEKFRIRKDKAHVPGNWFDNNGSDSIRVCLEIGSHTCEIVILRNERLTGKCFWNTMAIGQAKRQCTRPGPN